MEKRGLNKVDLIFEKVDSKEVLTKAYKMKSDEIIQQVLDSGLKGRGGAGFPTGLKWKYTAAVKEPEKYIVCNADEGEPGTFKDRVILTELPKLLFEGMAIAGPVSDVPFRAREPLVLGFLAGFPTVLGSIFGTLFYSDLAGVFFFSMAAGALLYVVIELTRRAQSPKSTLIGIVVGILLMYFTDLLLTI